MDLVQWTINIIGTWVGLLTLAATVCALAYGTVAVIRLIRNLGGNHHG